MTHEAFFSADRYEDLEAQAEQLSGYDQLYVQLDRGAFTGEFTRYRYPNGLALAIERVNRVIHQRAAVPRGVLMLGYIAETAEDYRINGRALRAGDMFILPGGADIEGMASKSSTIIVATLPQSALDRFEIGTKCFRPQVFAAGQAPAAVLGNLIQFANSGVISDPSLVTDSAVGEMMLGMFIAGLNALRSDDTCAVKDMAMYRNQVITFQRICKRLFSSPGDFSVTSACADMGISRRTAELSFDAVVGVSPSRYVKLCRLNLIRRTLRAQSEPLTTVGDLAMRYGLNHLGRLSGEYKQVFGVSPSLEIRQ